MGGKSTFIRAVGLCVLMSHIGSFVPATLARIPVIDRMLCRVGASDSLESGVSTFMAEMLDVAAILRKATKNSLVLIDELGRGTSTHEGFGIAWAVLDRLATQTKCLTLFATHFHELAAMEGQVEGVRNLHVSAAEGDDDLIMLYNVQKGACAKSYGIHAAKIAGFPAEILADATKIAEELEQLSTSNMNV